MATRSVPHKAPTSLADVFHAGNQLEGAIRFIDWCDRQQQRITGALVRDALGITKASAYRYASAYRAARGQA